MLRALQSSVLRSHTRYSAPTVLRHRSQCFSTGATPVTSDTPKITSDAKLETPQKPQTAFGKLLYKLKLYSPQQIVADPEKFNRWLIVPCAMGTHISLGSIFAFSMLSQPLTHIEGVVAASASDWTSAEVVPIFSTLMATFGAVSFICGRMGLNEKLGPRVTGLIGASSFASAFGLAALATNIHSLPLLYAGYGLLGGFTVGCAYVNPISNLMKWFPDRKGLASALAVMGFGAGGMVAAPLIQGLLKKHFVAPKFVGTADSVATHTHDGRMFASVDGQDLEVVVATKSALLKLGEAGELLQEGLYVVGSGSTGLAETFLTLGAIYSTAIFASAVAFRTAPEGYAGPRTAADLAISMKAEIPTSTPTVAVPDDRTARPEEAMEPKAAVRTKEFWLVWVGMCFNCAGAYGLLSCAKPMLMDVFAQPLPGLVTGAFAAAFVSAISFFNLSGRVAWGAVSDAVGTRKTTMMLWGLGIPAYAAMPLAAHLAHDPALATVAAYAPLGVFLAGVMLAISTFGGSAAVSPAYLSDLFGKKHVAAIHGQLLSFLLIAGYLGPMLLSTLSAHAARKAIDGLAAQVPDDVFLTTFGSPRSELPALIDAKTVTIPRLLELLPGTVDPTPFLYDEPLLVIAGLQLAALACALAIRSMPVAKMGLIKKPIIPKPPKNSAAVPPAAAAAAAAAKK